MSAHAASDLIVPFPLFPFLYHSPDPATQQLSPYLFQATKNLGGMAAAMPFMQDASRRVLGMLQGSEEIQGSNGRRQSSPSRNTIVREYRDVRPAKKRFSFTGEDESNSRKASQSYPNNPPYDVDNKKRKVSGATKQSIPATPNDSAMERIARFMGADLGNGDGNSRAKKSR